MIDDYITVPTLPRDDLSISGVEWSLGRNKWLCGHNGKLWYSRGRLSVGFFGSVMAAVA